MMLCKVYTNNKHDRLLYNIQDIKAKDKPLYSTQDTRIKDTPGR